MHQAGAEDRGEMYDLDFSGPIPNRHTRTLNANRQRSDASAGGMVHAVYRSLATDPFQVAKLLVRRPESVDAGSSPKASRLTELVARQTGSG